MMRLWPLAVTLLCVACGPQQRSEPLPELPALAMDRFLPAVRQEIQKAEAAARAKPTDADACGRLGMVLHAHEQYGSAESCYRRAHLLDGKAFRWLYYLALVQSSQGRSQDSAATLNRALSLDPAYQPAQLRLAETLIELGRIEESGAIYQRLLDRHADSAAAWYGLGRIQAARGEAAPSAESFRKACELFPAYGAAHYALAQAYRKLGDSSKAHPHLELYEKYKLSVPPAADGLLAELRRLSVAVTEYIRQGTDLEAQGKLAEAVAMHLKAIETDPASQQSHVNLISLYGRLNQFDKAEEHYQKAVALNPNMAEAHYNFGVLAFSRKRVAEARKAFGESLRINPNHPDAHNNTGYLLMTEGRLDEAAGHFRQAIANQPKHRLAHFHLGRILVNRRQYREAIAHFEQTLEPQDDSTPGYLYSLGATWGRAGDRQRALGYLRQARQQAAGYGQTQLISSIDRDLRSLGQAVR